MKVYGVNLAMIFLWLSHTTTTDASSFVCTDGQFRCVHNQTCIVSRWRCDGEVDCGDGSDEEGCPTKTCRPNDQFRCTNGKCIPKSWACDGEDDCKDGSASDEHNCANITCGPNEFTCKSKKCIVALWKCDKHDDCGDNSDEDPDTCKTVVHTCAANQFTCLTGQCITKRWLCDGDSDCSDGSDEYSSQCSSKTCASDEYNCQGSNNKCIRRSWRCDGDRDCPRGDDESGCPAVSPKTCSGGMFKCKNKECILGHWRCDGENDCSDGSDELNCHKSNCTSSQFSCASGRTKCIESGKRCDGKRDCSDGSDELRCAPAVPCTPDQFECGLTSVCIPKSELCDGNNDCPNAEDEPMRCNIDECLYYNGHCDHFCHDFKVGYNCSCKQGFKLQSNGRVCEDVNECLVYGKCSQICQNTKGSYKCLCRPGHALEPDFKTCRATGPEPSLIYSSQSSIRKMTMDGSPFNSIVSHRKGVVGLDFDIKSGNLFWTDPKLKKIHSTNLNGKGSVNNIVSDVKVPDAIAVDWIGRKIYWSDGELNMIEVAELDGSNRMVLYSSGLDEPRAIAVHPLRKYVYWSDWGYNARIERGSMDGAASSRQILVNTNIGWVNGMTIDYNIERVFWVDAKVKRIESMALDGTDRRLVASVLFQHPFAVTVFGDYLYYSDWSRNARAIRKVNKFTGMERSAVKHLLWPHMDIKVLHPSRQPNGTNPCNPNNGGCSHLCLLSAVTHTFTCNCPNGMNMSTNGKTCIGKPVTGQPTASPTTMTASSTQTTAAITRPITRPTTKSNEVEKPTKRTEKPTRKLSENSTGAVPTTKGGAVAAKRANSDTHNDGANVKVIVPIVIVLVLIIILVIVALWVWRTRFSNYKASISYYKEYKDMASKPLEEDFDDNDTTKVFDDGGPRCQVEFA